ncbi:hypothetical protein ACHAO7_011129 [Fusarium culmorum]
MSDPVTENLEEHDARRKDIVTLAREYMRSGRWEASWGTFDDDMREEIRSGCFQDMPEIPAPDEAREEVRENSKKVFDTYNLLNQIIQRHEATIQRRWIKKTREQRRVILLKAWPYMPKMYRPDIKAFQVEDQDKRSSKYGSKFKKCYMCPQSNQEDLSQPKLMLFAVECTW